MTNPAEKDIRSWVEASRYDLETARALFKSRRYLYVLFMCQQSLEKLLKAGVTTRTGEFPPRVHNLVRLGELAAVSISHDEKAFLERLSLYYLQSRYPPEIKDLARKIKQPTARDHLKQTEALWRRPRRQLRQMRSSGER